MKFKEDISKESPTLKGALKLKMEDNAVLPLIYII